VLQRFLDQIAAGTTNVGPVTTYALEDIPRAHADIDANAVAGKVAGLTAAGT
jgi:hypothetical protein